jgi:hypothetical protein
MFSQDTVYELWADLSSIKPVQAITELSGFSTLILLYSILFSLSVTSSTTEREMS